MGNYTVIDLAILIAGGALIGAGYVSYKAIELPTKAAIKAHRRHQRRKRFRENEEAEQRLLARVAEQSHLEEVLKHQPQMLSARHVTPLVPSPDANPSNFLLPTLRSTAFLIKLVWVGPSPDSFASDSDSDEDSDDDGDHDPFVELLTGRLPPLQIVAVLFDAEHQCLDFRAQPGPAIVMDLATLPAEAQHVMVMGFVESELRCKPGALPPRTHLRASVLPAAESEDILQSDAETLIREGIRLPSLVHPSERVPSDRDYWMVMQLSRATQTGGWRFMVKDQFFQPADDDAAVHVRKQFLTPWASASPSSRISFGRLTERMSSSSSSSSSTLQLEVYGFDRLGRLVDCRDSLSNVLRTFPSSDSHSQPLTGEAGSLITAREVVYFAVLLPPASDHHHPTITCRLTTEGSGGEVLLESAVAPATGHYTLLVVGDRSHVTQSSQSIPGETWRIVMPERSFPPTWLPPRSDAENPVSLHSHVSLHCSLPVKPLLLVKIEIHNCRNLAPKDRSGLSDPYVEISVELPESERVPEQSLYRWTTRYISQTLNPTWTSAHCHFLLSPNCSSFLPHNIQLTVMDHDTLSSDDFEGMVDFHLLEYRLDWHGEMVLQPCPSRYSREKDRVVSGLINFSVSAKPHDGGELPAPGEDIIAVRRRRGSSFRRNHKE